jgi:hypothetical protein
VKAPHLLRVDEGPDVFAPLLAALASSGSRAGWLEWAEPEPVPPSLARAAEAGALRAVAVGEGGSVAVKVRRGDPVLGDLLREHFLGCRLVLVRGAPPDPVADPVAAAMPRLVPVSGGSWRVETEGGRGHALSTDELVARLRRPRPWG